MVKSVSIEKNEILKIPAKVFGEKPKNGVTPIPENMGTGYIKGIIINSKLRLIIRQYELIQDIMLDRGIGDEEGKFVVIAFHNIYYSKDEIKNNSLKLSVSRNLLPTVQIKTSRLNYELLPANKIINSIVITIYADYLKELLKLEKGNTLLQIITSDNQPCLIEEIISPEMQEVLSKIIASNPVKELFCFYYKIKTEELIYSLFAELLKRKDTTLQSLNTADVKKLYQVKDKILLNIDSPPILAELVKLSGMSESKLKRLFKQIFGNSIYNYYQNFRMREAAYLLKEESLSVSEVGYRLGFSNLSHFTRLFEAHNGVKPKKYSLSK